MTDHLVSANGVDIAVRDHGGTGDAVVLRPGDQVRVTGRQAMGVMLLRLNANERVTSVFPVLEEPAPEDDPEELGVVAPDVIVLDDPASDPEGA